MLRALIIDDEAPARSELVYLLGETGVVDVCGEASNVRDAVPLIKSTPADVIFLDIYMPGFNGLQLAESLKSHPNPPAIVFVTAHSEHALAAFNVNALDYLVKPVDRSRLEAALRKVATVATSTALPLERDESKRVLVSKAGKKLFVASADIIYIMAKDDYSYIVTAEDRFLSTSSLTSLEESLSGLEFYRAHRRYLINLKQVHSISPTPGGTLSITLENADGIEIPVSRRRVGSLKKLLNL